MILLNKEEITKISSKPSYKDVQESKLHQLGQPTTWCAICLQEDDTESSAGYVDWVQCSSCDLWLHKTCAGVKDDKPIQNYSCPFCHK